MGFPTFHSLAPSIFDSILIGLDELILQQQPILISSYFLQSIFTYYIV